MSKEQVRMMIAKDKLVKEADNPLTKLFRLILVEVDMGPDRWNRRLTLFLKSRLSRVRKTAKDIGQERNNFNRAIAKREITWKTFQKAVQILGPLEYSMDATLILRDGRKIKVSSGRIQNPYTEIDSVQAMIGGKMTSDQDIIDYDDDEDGQYITAEDVSEVVGQIVDHGMSSHDKRAEIASRSIRHTHSIDD
jgi:hypothetical protein